MTDKEKIEQFYEDVERLALKFPVARISAATGLNKGTVSEYLNRKKEPSMRFLSAFYEGFGKSLKNVPRETHNNEEYKDKYIKSLESENSLLKDQLSLATGQIRHLLLLAAAKIETNQLGLADLLVKQKIVPAAEVEDKLSKENVENYQRLKSEVGIV